MNFGRVARVGAVCSNSGAVRAWPLDDHQTPPRKEILGADFRA